MESGDVKLRRITPNDVPKSAPQHWNRLPLLRVYAVNRHGLKYVRPRSKKDRAAKTWALFGWMYDPS